MRRSPIASGAAVPVLSYVLFRIEPFHRRRGKPMATVLVVEDEEHLRATLTYNLRKAGYDVQSAASGPEAMARFQATHPDLVLLDVMLPGFDGFEVCRR